MVVLGCMRIHTPARCLIPQCAIQPAPWCIPLERLHVFQCSGVQGAPVPWHDGQRACSPRSLHPPPPQHTHKHMQQRVSRPGSHMLTRSCVRAASGCCLPGWCACTPIHPPTAWLALPAAARRLWLDRAALQLPLQRLQLTQQPALKRLHAHATATTTAQLHVRGGMHTTAPTTTTTARPAGTGLCWCSPAATGPAATAQGAPWPWA